MSILARLNLDKTGFDAGLAAAGKSVSKFGGGLKSQLAGAFGAAAVLSFVKSSIDAAEAVGDLSERLGISIKDAQEFALAAKLGGSDVEYFATKLEKLRAVMAKAKAGENPLAAFGIDTNDPISAMRQLADLISTVGLNADQASKFVDIFGKGSGKMITVLGDLEKAKQAFKFSSADTRMAQEVNDQIGVWWESAKVLMVRMAHMALNPPVLRAMGVPGLTSSGTSRAASDLSGAEREMEAREESAKANMAIQDRILDLERDANQINERTRISKLTDAERLLELKREEKILQENLSTEVPDETGVLQEGAFMMMKRLAEVGAEIAGIDRKKDKRTGDIRSDEFGRIGAFSGGAGFDAQMVISKQSLGELEKLRRDLTQRGILVRGTD